MTRKTYLQKIVLHPVGIIKNKVNNFKSKGWDKVNSEIILKKKFLPAMEEVEKYSHLVVIFWGHKVKHIQLKRHPQNREDLPLVGVFATRSIFRPNPIGVSIVKLLKINKNRIKVKGLDALNNTPILDIKPYLSKLDLAEKLRVPYWIKLLHKN